MTNEPIIQPFCNYMLLDELGRGGVSTVYRARDNRSGNVVALKVLNPQMQASALAQERFRREPKMQFLHPKIVPVLDAGLCDGRMFFTMELIVGEPLERILKRGPLTPRQVYGYVRDVAEALDAAHQRGIVHRDIKPSNILVRATDNTALLTDFGVAKATGPATTKLTQPDSNPVGTSDYMSPELARTDPTITPASDIYSLGVTVFHALAGRLPFGADNPYVVAHKHANQIPPDLRSVQPKVSPLVSRVVMRALAKEPGKRYPSAGAFANAFTEAVMQSQNPSVTAPRQGLGTVRAITIGLSALAALLLIAGAVFVVNGIDTRPTAPTPPTPLPRIMPTAAVSAPVGTVGTVVTVGTLSRVPATATQVPATVARLKPTVAPPVPTAVPAVVSGPTVTAGPNVTATPTFEPAATATTGISKLATDAPTATLAPTATVTLAPTVTLSGTAAVGRLTPLPNGTPGSGALQVNVNGKPGYVRWGKPLTRCSTDTDDKTPVLRFEVNVNLTNTGTTPLSKLGAQFTNQNGSAMDTCTLRGSGPLGPGQTTQFILATYTDAPVVDALTLAFDGETRRLCFAGDSATLC